MTPKQARQITRSLNQLLLSATRENVGDLQHHSLLDLLHACKLIGEHYPKEIIPSERRVAMLFLLLDERYSSSPNDSSPNLALNGVGVWVRNFEGREMRAA